MKAFIKEHAAIAAASSWLLLLCALVWLSVPQGYSSVNLIRPFEIGENWIYALRPLFDNNLFPYFPTLLAFLQYHLPAWLHYAAIRALFMLPLLLAFSGGILVRSLRAGVFSGSLTAALSCFLLLRGELQYEQHAEQVLIAAALLMTAGGAAFGLRKPLKGLFMGLLISTAVYIKGVLVICAPVLMFCGLLKHKGRPSLKSWLPAAGVFFVAISIWSLLNLHTWDQFVVLEGRGRSEGMIAIGAAGLVTTMEGDWRSLPGIPLSGNQTLWALRGMALHPLRFLGIVSDRVQYLSKHSLPPLLLGCLSLLCLAGLIRLRNDQEARPLILLALCFTGVHLFFPIEPRYFVPVWFLMCAIAGIGLAAIFDHGESGTAGALAAGRAFFLAAVLPLTAFLVYVLALVSSFTLRIPRADIGGLLARHQNSPFLYSEAGRSAAVSGDHADAAEFYLKAYRLEKNSWRKEAYLRSGFLAGTLTGDEIRAYQETADFNTPMFAALRYAEEGKTAKAKNLFSCALQLCVVSSAGIRGPSGPKDLQRVAALRRTGADDCVRRLSEMLAELPMPRRAAVNKAVDAIYPRLRRPGTLADDFARQNAALGGLAAYAASNINAGEGVPQGCTGELPSPPPGSGGAGTGAPAAGKVRKAEAVPCSAAVPPGNREKALEVCQALVYSVDSGEVPFWKGPGIMRSEALLESYELLAALGRVEEARESLVWAVKMAPAGWKRLPEAEAKLRKAGN